MPEPGKYDRSLSAAARKKAQRRTLLQAATAVFAERGFADATVEDIVQTAGVSRKTYYAHFDDLAGALAEVYDFAGEFATRFVDAQLAAAPPREKLEHGIRALLSLVKENPGLARVLFGEAASAGARIERRRDKLRAHFTDLLSTTLREMHARREVPHPPHALAVHAVVAGIEAVGARLAADGSLDDATAAMVCLARATCER